MQNDQDKSATDRGGIGSTYGGTQSPDPKAPDGNQKPSDRDQQVREGKTDKHEGLGDEYQSDSSYGADGKQPDKENCAGITT